MRCAPASASRCRRSSRRPIISCRSGRPAGRGGRARRRGARPRPARGAARRPDGQRDHGRRSATRSTSSAAGCIEQTDARFTDDERVRAVIERIVTPLGRRIDESSPLRRRPPRGRLPRQRRDPARSRCAALASPSASSPKKPLDRARTSIALRRADTARWRASSSAAVQAAQEHRHLRRHRQRQDHAAQRAVGRRSRRTSASSPSRTRPSCSSMQPHVVSLEARPANMEGQGEITIRDLVKNALRMRPTASSSASAAAARRSTCCRR